MSIMRRGSKGCLHDMTVICYGTKGCFREFYRISRSSNGCFREIIFMCRGSEGCPRTFEDFSRERMGIFAMICCEVSLFSFFAEDWSSFAKFCSGFFLVLAVFVSSIANLFIYFMVEGGLAASIVCGVCGPFARFITAAKVVLVGWATIVAATSFSSVEMVICMSLKDFEETFSLCPATASL